MKITRGKKNVPVRTVIYGAEGIGKSTLAAQLPDPLFIDVEGGTHQLDIARFEDTPKTWNELLGMVDEVIADPDGFKTLVIDTADRSEQLLIEQLLSEDGKKSIEQYGGGYGKGYTAIMERFQKDLLARLDRLISQGVNVVLIAHAQMRKFESPEDPPYDRWELKVSKKLAPVIKEWSDLLLFCNYQFIVSEDGNGKAKARGQGKRMMYTTHRPTYDAKNRYGLADELPMSFEPLKEIFQGTVPKTLEKVVLNPETPHTIIEENPAEDILTAFRRNLAQHGIDESAVVEWLSKERGITSLEKVPTNMLMSMNTNIETLVTQINK